MTGAADRRAIGKGSRVFRRGQQVQKLDTGLIQATQFARIGDTILVGVLPDAEFAPTGILSIEHVIMVGVEDTTQALKVRDGAPRCTSIFRRIFAGDFLFGLPLGEGNFASLVDLAITTSASISGEINRQQTI